MSLRLGPSRQLKRRRRATHARRLQLEALEDRRVLALPIAVDDLYRTHEGQVLNVNPVPPGPVDTPLVVAGSIWKYFDNGTDQGTAWRELNFDDSSWVSG